MLFEAANLAMRAAWRKTKRMELFCIIFPASSASSTMERKWYLAIPREDREISGNSFVCSLHFHNEDYSYGSLDTNAWRRTQRELISSDFKKLKEDSVPNIFPNLPPMQHSDGAREKRHGQQQERLDKQIEDFFERQSCNSSGAFKLHKFL